MTDAIDWLLEDDVPGVALQARARLRGESPRSRAMLALRRRVNEYPPVARMLARIDDCLAEKDYQKYRGAYWTLNFLGEMQADGRDARARRLGRHVLGKQLPEGGFSTDGRATWEIVCLTANTLRALVGLGFGEHPGVARGYRRLAQRINPCGGVPCWIIDQHSMLTTCRMTLPQTLRSVAAAPSALRRTRALRELQALLVRRLTEIGAYRYVRADRAAFREQVEQRPKGTTFVEFKARWLEEHPEEQAELGPKTGWQRFGFPRSYNSDLLEALLALAEAGAPCDPALDEALDQVESKRGRDGRWRLEDLLAGKALADVERKGRPSKWLTLRALVVLQHFGRAST